MEFEAVDEGTLGKILVPEGTEGIEGQSADRLLLEEGEDKSALDKREIAGGEGTGGACTSAQGRSKAGGCRSRHQPSPHRSLRLR